jgi:hypothetical protein
MDFVHMAKVWFSGGLCLYGKVIVQWCTLFMWQSYGSVVGFVHMAKLWFSGGLCFDVLNTPSSGEHTEH